MELRTVGGYEVLRDGDDEVRLHQLHACLKYEPENVFNTRYVHVHHRNTVGWDNRIENLLLFRARYHNTFHRRQDWTELCEKYGKRDVSEIDVADKEKYYETITQNYFEDSPY